MTSGIVLTVIDQGWPGSEPRLGPELEEYTRQTGIRVQILPAPEAAVEQLATWRELLESRAEVPDVYAIDTIWPRVLADSLIDLKPYVPAEDIAVHFPELIANYTVDGKLVALPYNTERGLVVLSRRPARKIRVWRTAQNMGRTRSHGQTDSGRRARERQ